MPERGTACLHRAGATAEKRQVPLHINETAGEKEGGEAEERRPESPREQKDTTREEKEEKQGRSKVGTAANEEDAFRNGLG